MSFNLTGSGYEMDMDAVQLDPVSFHGYVTIRDLHNPDVVFYDDLFLLFGSNVIKELADSDAIDYGDILQNKSVSHAFVQVKPCKSEAYPPFFDLNACLKENPALLKAVKAQISNMFLHMIMWDFFKEHNQEQFDDATMGLYRFFQKHWRNIERIY